MGELAYPLKIRAHHLLCLLGFRGLGYSPEFVETMGWVLNAFQSDTRLPLVVVTECDVICKSCPYEVENECRKSENSATRVKEKDAAILKKLGLRSNSRTTSREVRNRVKSRISPDDLTTMCSRCQWLELGYCREGLKKLRT